MKYVASLALKLVCCKVKHLSVAVSVIQLGILCCYVQCVVLVAEMTCCHPFLLFLAVENGFLQCLILQTYMYCGNAPPSNSKHIGL